MRRLLLSATTVLALSVLIATACDDVTQPPLTTLSLSVVSGDGQSGEVGRALPDPLVIKATDSKGRPQRNLLVDFRVTAGGGSVYPTSARTNQDGIAQTTWTLGTSTTQAQRVEARATSTNALLGAFSATPLPGPPTQLTKHAGDGQSAVHGTPVPIPPAVLLQDQYGNVVPGGEVTFYIFSGGGSVTGASPISGPDGVATIGSWTLGSVLGENTLNAANPWKSVTFSATSVIGPVDPAKSTVNASPSSITASSGSSASEISVAAKDAGNYVISGATVVIAATGPGNTITQPAAPTDMWGYAKGALSSTVVGHKVVSITINGITINQTPSITVTSGPAATIAVRAGDGQSAPHGTPVAIAPEVLVKDQFGNVVPGVTVTFAVTSGGGSVTGATPTTNSDGVATVGSWTLGPGLGTNALTASITGLTPATFTATAVSGEVSAAQSTVSSAPASIIVGSGSSTITVVAKDASGFAVSGATVVIAATGSGNTVTQPAATTDATGKATGTLSSTALGQKVVSATINGIAVTQTTTVNVNGGPAATIVLYEGDAQTGYTNEMLPTRAAVRVQDAFGNPVSGANVFYAMIEGDGGFCCLQPMVTNADGVASIGWVLGVYPGQNVIRATTAGVSGSVTFTATGITRAASIEVYAGDNQVASVGKAVAIQPTVLVRNAAGDPLMSVVVEFVVSAGGGSTIGGDHATMPDGLTHVDGWTLGPTPGTNTLIARVARTDIAVTFTAQGDPGIWTRLPDMPTRRFVLAADSLGGLFYAVGGLDFTYMADVEAYDPVTGIWTTKAPMPTPRSELGVASVNGILYAIGGVVDGYVATTAVEAYDPVTNTWTTRAPLPSPRADLVVAVVNGIIYAIGGVGCLPEPPGSPCTFGTVGTVEAYDPATDSWTTKSPMPTPRFTPGVGVVNGTVYVVGGSDYYTWYMTTVEAYDPQTDTWSTKAPLHTPRGGLMAGAIDGVLYAIGGGVPPPNPINATNGVEAYDPVTNTWVEKPPTLFPRWYSGAAVVNGLLYVAGGNGAFAEFEVYRPE